MLPSRRTLTQAKCLLFCVLFGLLWSVPAQAITVTIQVAVGDGVGEGGPHATSPALEAGLLLHAALEG